MRWLVDAQLPERLAEAVAARGHQAVHTKQLAQGNATPDRKVCEIADHGGFIVVSKDSDFVDSLLLASTPRKLLLISTGNIGNSELLELVESSLPDLEVAFAQSNFVELSRTALIIHD